MGSYVPSTRDERQEMMEVIGVSGIEELFTAVPSEIKIENLHLPSGKCEMEVLQEMTGLAGKNKVFGSIFRGAGAYRHYIPPIVKAVTSKEEFLTAYTPYQAEISQGVLQSIYEFQTMMCALTGMDVSNASVYDGATAAAEAAAMCVSPKRRRVIVAASLPPSVIETIGTYCFGSGCEMIVAPSCDGQINLSGLENLLDDATACVISGQPNYYGILEDISAVSSRAKSAGAKHVLYVNPIALAILPSPRETGADVAVGEGQPLGIPLSFGGPYLGFMTCTEEMTRKLPGRIVGETIDADGKRAFVLTLQAREQHIRREKASSNICSNQAHCALTAGVYLSSMGPKGLKQAADLCVSKAHYMASELCKIPGIRQTFSGEFFHEFVTTCPIPAQDLMRGLEHEDILGGLPLADGTILWCATEVLSREQIDRLCEVVREECGK